MSTIVIDAGHGTYSEHKSHVVNGKKVYEGFINRQLAGMLGALLEWDGHNVIYTVNPNDTRDLSLSYRVRVANQYKDSVFISLHSNASRGHNAEGWEIFTSRGKTNSDLLAECIADEVQKIQDKTSIRLRFDFSDGDKDKEADFYVLRKTRGVAVLIETLFFDNPKDYKKLDTLEFRQQIVVAYYRGVTRFLSQ